MAWKKDRALHLVLILIDEVDDHETRMSAAECFSDLCKVKDVLDFVTNRLFSSRIPNIANLKVAKRYIPEDQFLSVFDELARYQNSIHRLREAWDSLPVELFGDLLYKDRFREVAIDSGVFKSFIKAGDELSSLISHDSSAIKI